MAALSGLLLTLSFPNLLVPRPAWFQPLVAFVALVPLLAALKGKTPRQGFGLGWLAGLLFFGLMSHWQPRAWPAGWPSWLAWGAMAGGFALYPAAFAGAVAWMRARRIPWPGLWLPALWTVTEQAREVLFTGMPAFSLGSSQAGNPLLLPLASLAGVAGLHFVVALGNWLVLEGIERGWRPARRPAAMILSSVAVLAALAAFWPRVPGPTRPAALLQGSLGSEGEGPGWEDRAMRVYSELSIQAMFEGARLLVWPESAFPDSPFDE